LIIIFKIEDNIDYSFVNYIINIYLILN